MGGYSELLLGMLGKFSPRQGPTLYLVMKELWVPPKSLTEDDVSKIAKIENVQLFPYHFSRSQEKMGTFQSTEYMPPPDIPQILMRNSLMNGRIAMRMLLRRTESPNNGGDIIEEQKSTRGFDGDGKIMLVLWVEH